MIETLAGGLARAGYDMLAPTEKRGSITDAIPGSGDYQLLTLGDGMPTYTGRAVTPEIAMTYTAVYACVKIYAEGIGSLPLLTYRNASADGLQRVLATDDYRYRMLREQPNDEMTSMELREFSSASLDLWGNSYCYLDWDGRMRLRGIWPMWPNWMTVLRNPRTLKREYHYRPLYPMFTPVQSGVYEQYQVAHVSGLGFDGLVGCSPIAMFRNSVANGLAYQEQTGRFIAGGGTQKLALTSTNKLTDPEKIRQEWMRRNGSLAKSGDIAILHGGIDVKTFGIPPRDAQTLEGRSWEISEVARMYGVPIGMLEDTLAKPETYASAEQADLRFVKWRIRPRCVRIEQKWNTTALGNNDSLTCQHDLDDLLRGDLLSQMNAWKTGVTGAIVEPNEARLKMNLPPSSQDGADKLWAQAQMVELGKTPPVPVPALMPPAEHQQEPEQQQ